MAQCACGLRYPCIECRRADKAMRTVPEWIGKTDDTPVPPRVKLRVFEHCGGICHISGRLIRAGEPWQIDHRVPLIAGGEHREFNLAPALIAFHKAKTKEEVREKSTIYHKKAKHIGISTKKKNPFPGSRNSKWKRKIDGTIVKR